MNRTGRIEEIDALRGVAALGVILYHVASMLPASGHGVDGHAGALIGLLWSLVDLFFVISGFVFAHVYIRNGTSARPGTTMRSFAVARFARLYPLHLATLVAVAALVALHRPTGDLGRLIYDARHFALNLLMLQGSGLETWYSFNTSSWSLTPEILCYAVFAVVLFRTPSRIGAWAVTAIAVALCSRVSPTPFLPIALARGLTGFFAGVLLHRHRARLTTIGTPWLLAAVPIGFVVAKLLERALGLNLGMGLSLVAWPALIATVTRRPFSGIMRSRPMTLLGDLSFSSYLIHVPIMMAMTSAWDGPVPAGDLVCFCPVLRRFGLMKSKINPKRRSGASSLAHRARQC